MSVFIIFWLAEQIKLRETELSQGFNLLWIQTQPWSHLAHIVNSYNTSLPYPSCLCVQKTIFMASNPLRLHISTLYAAMSSCCVSIKTAGDSVAHCSTPHHTVPMLHNCMLTLPTTKTPCSFLNILHLHFRLSVYTFFHIWAHMKVCRFAKICNSSSTSPLRNKTGKVT